MASAHAWLKNSYIWTFLLENPTAEEAKLLDTVYVAYMYCGWSTYKDGIIGTMVLCERHTKDHMLELLPRAIWTSSLTCSYLKRPKHVVHYFEIGDPHIADPTYDDMTEPTRGYVRAMVAQGMLMT